MVACVMARDLRQGLHNSNQLLLCESAEQDRRIRTWTAYRREIFGNDDAQVIPIIALSKQDDVCVIGVGDLLAAMVEGVTDRILLKL